MQNLWKGGVLFKMIQLYTKDIDGNFEKVHWKTLKVIPEIKVREARVRLYNKLQAIGTELVSPLIKKLFERFDKELKL